jgi:hypothetical protein
MIIHDVVQGSREWTELRLGLPTASEFHKILTPGGQLSEQARSYAYYLVAEALLNTSLDSLSHLEYLARGKELEPEAVRMYEFHQEVETKLVGFITTDDLRIGCTPDRLLIGANAALEIKCPAPQTQVKYRQEGYGKEYRPQVQGQCYVGEFDYVDWYSYHPSLSPVLVRAHRDEGYIRKLAVALDLFCAMKDKILEAERASGYFEERRRLLTATDDQARSSLARELGDYLQQTC